jgi:predicted hydrocarbon binding protein
MHGVIFAELKKFAESKTGLPAWSELLTAAGLASMSYAASDSYPDEHVGKIVAAASQRTGLSAQSILESFGEFIAPDLLSMVPSLLRPEWRTLDVLEHSEREIHTVVRAQNPQAKPPYLTVHRTSAREVVIFYDSPRKLCSVAKGIVKGLARHFGDAVAIVEERCMHAGAPDCTMVITAVS